jgi:hypothetical protein
MPPTLISWRLTAISTRANLGDRVCPFHHRSCGRGGGGWIGPGAGHSSQLQNRSVRKSDDVKRLTCSNTLISFPLLPLAASVLILFFGKKLPLGGAFLGILAVGWGVVQSFGILASVYLNPDLLPLEGVSGRFFERTWDWFTVGPIRVETGVMIDGMAAMMLVVVTVVSLLVQVYSLGYQHGKPRFSRYYAYLSFFTSAMLLLVVANNLCNFLWDGN